MLDDSHPPLAQRLAGKWVAWRWWLLGLAALLAAVAFGPSRRVQFDRSLENMFAPDDPLLPPYQKLKRVFGGNELVLAAYSDPDLLHPDGSGIRRLAEISRSCERVPGVRAVLSLDRSPLGERVVATDMDLARRTRELFENYTHGSDGRTAAVVCMLEPESETAVPRRETLDQLRRIVGQLPQGLPPGVLAGEPVMVEDGFRYVEEDGRRLGLWSSLLVGATIILFFRSLRWVLIPLAVVQFALLVTDALVVWSQLRLSMVSSMLTAVVTVVGVATVVHVIVRFRQARDEGLSPQAALTRTGSWLAMPVLWACVTDAVGFGSLAAARVGPVQDFGAMMAAGSMMVFVSVALLVPGLGLWGPGGAGPRRSWGETSLHALVSGLLSSVSHRPKTLAALAAAAVAFTLAGVCRLEVETDFTRNFRSGSPIVRSYEYIESRLGGAGVWDIILPAPASLNWEYLRRVQDLEERLRREVLEPAGDGKPAPALTKVLSLSDAVIATSPANLARISPRFLREGMVQAALKGMRLHLPAFVAALHGEDPQQPGRYYFRVMLRAKERQGTQAKRRIIEEVTRISREEFPASGDSPGAEVSGFFVLLTDLIESILRDQWLTFGVATAGIGAAMALAFRSLRLALVALVPNAMPVLLVMGVLGWLGLPVNMGAAMIAAVSIGLSVDSSIHYIVAFRRERAQGKDVQAAMREVQQTVGLAMVFSILALIVGFTALGTSQFVPTIYFGVLVSLAMLGGLLGNLLVLPLLLSWVAK